ncbi:hypothetical protein [Rhodoligotrophos appendicifer]
MEVTAYQLQAAVENMPGGTARGAICSCAGGLSGGAPLWEGVVHVFDLAGNPTATCAYAWSSPIDDSDKRRMFAVLHFPPIASPLAAVRAVIVAEHRAKG